MEKKEKMDKLARQLDDAIEGKSIDSEAEEDRSEFKSESEPKLESNTKKNGTLIIDIKIF